MKNPTKYKGVNNSWSAAIRVNTLADFLVVSLNSRFPTIGKILQYHKWSKGPQYVDPTKKRFAFLLKSMVGFLSMTDVNLYNT